MKIYIKDHKVLRRQSWRWYYGVDAAKYKDKYDSIVEINGVFYASLVLHKVNRANKNIKIEYRDTDTGIIFPVALSQFQDFIDHTAYGVIDGYFEFYRAGEFNGIRRVDIKTIAELFGEKPNE